MTKQIPKNLYSRINELCQRGQSYEEKENFELAVKSYLEALALIPSPLTDWEASTWILTAIGDMYFLLSQYNSALPYLEGAMHCPDAIGNPFIHLRLGQVQYELGNANKAKDELTRAFLIEGEDIFSEEDPKYLTWVKIFQKNL